MRGYIANTDAEWFEFLRRQPPLEEVNFWNPSDYYLFRGLVGSPFFFRLKSPINAIGGFGLVAYADRMPEWLAWECFGSGNGAPNPNVLHERIRRLREKSKVLGRQSLNQIGCIVLSQPVFFPPELWIPQPSDWQKANLRYAAYDLSTGEGQRIWLECTAHAQNVAAPVTAAVEDAIAAERFGAPIVIQPRLGQGVFRLFQFRKQHDKFVTPLPAYSVRPAHAVEMFGLLGGGKADGAMGGLPHSQLAVLPGTTHFSILARTNLLLPFITPFLDAPMPVADRILGLEVKRDV